MSLLLFIGLIWGQNDGSDNNQLNNDNKSYNLPVRIDLILGVGQQHYIDLNPKVVFANFFHNDISGSVFFDELDKEFFEKILNKIHKEVPRKYWWILPIGVTDSTIGDYSISARDNYLNNKYSDIYRYVVPTTISYSKNSDYELLMLNNSNSGFIRSPYRWIDIVGDVGITTLMYHDKITFEKPKWAIRPSVLFALEFRAFPKRWPIILGVHYGKRYLWPISFYNDKKFSQIEQKMITLSFNFKKDFPIRSDLLD